MGSFHRYVLCIVACSINIDKPGAVLNGECNFLTQNKQCDVVLNSTLNSKFLSSPPEELSDEGKVVVKDLRDVVEQVKKLILGKNEDQLLQEFFWEVRRTATQELNKPDGVFSEKEEVPVEKDANRALEGLRALGNLLLTNGEFRKLCKDD